MATTEATVSTQHASRYLQQLCKHWAHKFTVEFDPVHGHIANEGKAVTMTALPDALKVQVSTDDADMLPRWRQVVEDHLIRFAFREELAFDWSDS